MSKETLKALLRLYLDITFEEFCKEIFPDFSATKSRDYLSGKFGQFQHRFILFLAELDETHLGYLADAITKRVMEKN